MQTVQDGINRVYHILVGVEFGIEEEYDENKDYEKIFLHYKKNSEHLTDKNKEEKDKKYDDK